MSSIRLHPEHGVNPTVTVCFFCNKDTGVALLGAGFKGRAPHRMVMNYEPCEECQANMAKGITLIEATEQPNHAGQPELQKGVYPTGRWAVITEDAAKRWFLPNVVPQILEKRKAFVTPGIIPEDTPHEPGHA
jgi:hypothetical protein